MSPLSFILELLTKLPVALSATRRLVEATKASEPPPPVPITGEADALLKGANNQMVKDLMRQERLTDLRARLRGEAEKPEEPVE
jgi:hypothetical protein